MKKAGTDTKTKAMKDTLLECGGVYEMKFKDPYGQSVRGMMLASSNEGKKDTKVSGILQIMGFKPEVVHAGGERLNQFKLVGRAVPVKGPGRPPKDSK